MAENLFHQLLSITRRKIKSCINKGLSNLYKFFFAKYIKRLALFIFLKKPFSKNDLMFDARKVNLIDENLTSI